VSDVLVLGGSGVDTVVYVPELPLPYADSYQVPAIETRAGQTGDNVALGLSALGFGVVHVDVLGDDREGDMVAALHERHGVPLVRVPTTAGTKRAVNLVGPDGRRLSLYDSSRGDDADRFPDDLLKTGARHVHVSITQPCRQALDVIAETGATVSVDLHNWDGAEPYHEPFAHAADIVFLSTEALPEPEPVMRRIAERGKASVVVGTGGASGGLYLCEGVLKRYPAAPLPGPVVDSNGAGDAFVSGFLYGYLNGHTVASSVQFGSVAGAHACTVSATEVHPIDRATLLTRSCGTA
jgi:sugar/nucleoside kinase (ribokinase family)